MTQEEQRQRQIDDIQKSVGATDAEMKRFSVQVYALIDEFGGVAALENPDVSALFFTELDALIGNTFGARRTDATNAALTTLIQSEMVTTGTAKYAEAASILDLTPDTDVVAFVLQMAAEEYFEENIENFYRWLLTNDKAPMTNAVSLLQGPATQRQQAARAMFVDANRKWVNPNGYSLSDRVWMQGQQIRSTITSEIQDGLASGRSADDIARRIREYVDPDYAPLKYYKNGKIVRSGGGRPNAASAARRLARTEIAHAGGMATIQSAHDIPFGVLGVRWRISGSHPGEDVCDVKATQDLYGLGPGIYPVDKVPPYPSHPNCLCTLVHEHKDRDATRRDIVNAARERAGLPPIDDSFKMPSRPLTMDDVRKAPSRPRAKPSTGTKTNPLDLIHAPSTPDPSLPTDGSLALTAAEKRQLAAAKKLQTKELAEATKIRKKVGRQHSKAFREWFVDTQDEMASGAATTADELLEELTMPMRMPVYRGASQRSPFGELTIGDEIKLPDMDPLSVVRAPIADQDIVLEIEVPKNYPAVHTDHLNGVENEIILRRDTTIKITGMKEVDGKTVLQAEVVSSPLAPPTPKPVTAELTYDALQKTLADMKASGWVTRDFVAEAEEFMRSASSPMMAGRLDQYYDYLVRNVPNYFNTKGLPATWGGVRTPLEELTDVMPPFTGTFRDRDEALDWFTKVGVDFTGGRVDQAPLELLEEYARAHRNMIQAGYDPPRKIIFEPYYMEDDILGEYDYGDLGVRLNTKDWDEVRVHRETLDLHKKKWHASDDPLSTYYHEAAHALDQTNLVKPERWTLTKEEAEWMREHVGRYGSVEGHEAVAEIFSGWMSGLSYPKVIDDIFEKYSSFPRPTKIPIRYDQIVASEVDRLFREGLQKGWIPQENAPLLDSLVDGDITGTEFYDIIVKQNPAFITANDLPARASLLPNGWRIKDRDVPSGISRVPAYARTDDLAKQRLPIRHGDSGRPPAPTNEYEFGEFINRWTGYGPAGETEAVFDDLDILLVQQLDRLDSGDLTVQGAWDELWNERPNEMGRIFPNARKVDLPDEFIPATTQNQAWDFFAALNIATPIDPDVPLAVLNDIQEAMYVLAKHDQVLPTSIVWNKDRNLKAIATMSPTGQMTVGIRGTADEFVRDPYYASNRSFAQKWHSTGDPLGTYYHEVGHYNHAVKNTQLFNSDVYRAELPAAEAVIIRRDVSRYGATNPVEVVAEVYAGHFTGRTFSDEAMAIYRKYGGPDLPKVEVQDVRKMDTTTVRAFAQDLVNSGWLKQSSVRVEVMNLSAFKRPTDVYDMLVKKVPELADQMPIPAHPRLIPKDLVIPRRGGSIVRKADGTDVAITRDFMSDLIYKLEVEVDEGLYPKDALNWLYNELEDVLDKRIISVDNAYLEIGERFPDFFQRQGLNLNLNPLAPVDATIPEEALTGSYMRSLYADLNRGPLDSSNPVHRIYFSSRYTVAEKYEAFAKEFPEFFKKTRRPLKVSTTPPTTSLVEDPPPVSTGGAPRENTTGSTTVPDDSPPTVYIGGVKIVPSRTRFDDFYSLETYVAPQRFYKDADIRTAITDLLKQNPSLEFDPSFIAIRDYFAGAYLPKSAAEMIIHLAPDYAEARGWIRRIDASLQPPDADVAIAVNRLTDRLAEEGRTLFIPERFKDQIYDSVDPKVLQKIDEVLQSFTGPQDFDVRLNWGDGHGMFRDGTDRYYMELDVSQIHRLPDEQDYFKHADYAGYDTVQYAITHEYGHYLHKLNTNPLKSWDMPGGDVPAAVRERVSAYAWNNNEFIAEVFAMSSLGRKFDDEVMSYYRKYLGGDIVKLPEVSRFDGPPASLAPEIEPRKIADQYKDDLARFSDNTPTIEKDLWSSYKYTNYKTINTALRSGDLTTIDPSVVDILDRAFGRYTLDGPTKIYRGSFTKAGRPSRWGDLKPGDHIIDDGYMSTTHSRTTARKFYQPEHVNRSQIDNLTLFEITAPAGQAYVPLDGVLNMKLKASKKYVEQELVLPRGTEMRVISVKERDGVTTVKAEIVPKTPHAPASMLPPASMMPPDDVPRPTWKPDVSGSTTTGDGVEYHDPVSKALFTNPKTPISFDARAKDPRLNRLADAILDDPDARKAFVAWEAERAKMGVHGTFPGYVMTDLPIEHRLMDVIAAKESDWQAAAAGTHSANRFQYAIQQEFGITDAVDYNNGGERMNLEAILNGTPDITWDTAWTPAAAQAEITWSRALVRAQYNETQRILSEVEEKFNVDLSTTDAYRGLAFKGAPTGAYKKVLTADEPLEMTIKTRAATSFTIGTENVIGYAKTVPTGGKAKNGVVLSTTIQKEDILYIPATGDAVSGFEGEIVALGGSYTARAEDVTKFSPNAPASMLPPDFTPTRADDLDDAWLQSEAARLHDELEIDELRAVENYKQESFERINTQLRAVPGFATDPEVMLLDSAIMKAPIQQPATVHRGMVFYDDKTPEWLQDLGVGDEFVDYGFTSTSVSMDTALEFSGGLDLDAFEAFEMDNVPRKLSGTHHITIDYELPAGTNVLPIEYMTAMPQGQGELLLPRGLPFTVGDINIRYNDAGDKLTDIRLTLDGWTPSTTLEHAQAWAKDSALGDQVFYRFVRENAYARSLNQGMRPNDGLVGKWIYSTDTPNFQYTGGAGADRVISFTTNLKNPLIVDRRELSTFERTMLDNGITGDTATMVKAAGYDSLVLKRDDGSSWILMGDPKQARIITNPPKPRDPWTYNEADVIDLTKILHDDPKIDFDFWAGPEAGYQKYTPLVRGSNADDAIDAIDADFPGAKARLDASKEADRKKLEEIYAAEKATPNIPPPEWLDDDVTRRLLAENAELQKMPEWGGWFGYKSMGARPVNEAMRENKVMWWLGAEEQQAQRLAAFGKWHTPEATIVHRGLIFNPFDIPDEYRDMHVGQLLTDAGFISTSANKSIATSYAGNLQMQGQIRFDIEVPKNATYVPLDGSIRGEAEMVFPPGSSVYTVEIDELPGGAKVVKGILLPAGTPEPDLWDDPRVYAQDAWTKIARQNAPIYERVMPIQTPEIETLRAQGVEALIKGDADAVADAHYEIVTRWDDELLEFDPYLQQTNMVHTERRPWAPTMTPAEARDFAGSGYYSNRTFFHFTYAENVPGIRQEGLHSGAGIFGDGVYLTTVPTIESTGLSREGREMLQTTVRVNNPYRWRMYDPDTGEALPRPKHEDLIRRGYDSLIVEGPIYNDTWLVVFDRSNVTVVDFDPPPLASMPPPISPPPLASMPPPLASMPPPPPKKLPKVTYDKLRAMISKHYDYGAKKDGTYLWASLRDEIRKLEKAKTDPADFFANLVATEPGFDDTASAILKKKVEKPVVLRPEVTTITTNPDIDEAGRLMLSPHEVNTRMRYNEETTSQELFDISEDVLDDWGQYGNGWYKELNKGLRDGDEAMTARAQEMLEAFKFAMPTPMIVYRGMSTSRISFTTLKPGDRLDDASFLSTSYVEDVARGFLKIGLERPDRYPILLEIELPTGTPYFPMSGFLGYDGTLDSDEFEIVLAPNTSLRVTGMTVDADGVHHVKAIVDDAPPNAETVVPIREPLILAPSDVEARIARFDSFDGRFPDTARAAWISYTSGGFDRINRFLRGDIEELNEWEADRLAHLIESFKAFKLSERTTLYRGVVFAAPPDEFSNLAAGDIVSDPAFLSTSYDRNVGDRVGTVPHDSGEDAMGFVFEIETPAGTSYVPLDPLSGEDEIVLPPGTQLRIISTTQVSPKKTIVRATLLGGTP